MHRGRGALDARGNIGCSHEESTPTFHDGSRFEAVKTRIPMSNTTVGSSREIKVWSSNILDCNVVVSIVENLMILEAS